jgi:hypothetical protein
MIDSMGHDLNPVDGILSIPCTGLGIGNTPGMSTRAVLAENLKALMKRPSLNTLPKITEASHGRLSNGKLDRVRRAAAATDIDTIEMLAEVFGLEPWQLLQDDIGASAPHLSHQVAPSAGELGDAMRLVAAAIVKVDEEERDAIARMFSLLITQPAKAGTTAQSIALLLSGAASGGVQAETKKPKGATVAAEIKMEEGKDGTGDIAPKPKSKARGR